jgi:hypothetical protein
VKTTQRGLGRVGGDLGHVVLDARDVTLVGRRPPRAHLLHRHDDLGGVESIHDRRQFGRGHRRRALDHLLAGNVDVDEVAGERDGIDRHRFLRSLDVDRVIRDEPIDEIELFPSLPVHLDYPSVLDGDARIGIVRALHRDEAHLRPLVDEPVLGHPTFAQALEALRAPGFGSFYLPRPVRRGRVIF